MSFFASQVPLTLLNHCVLTSGLESSWHSVKEKDLGLVIAPVLVQEPVKDLVDALWTGTHGVGKIIEVEVVSFAASEVLLALVIHCAFASGLESRCRT